MVIMFAFFFHYQCLTYIYSNPVSSYHDTHSRMTLCLVIYTISHASFVHWYLIRNISFIPTIALYKLLLGEEFYHVHYVLISKLTCWHTRQLVLSWLDTCLTDEVFSYHDFPSCQWCTEFVTFWSHDTEITVQTYITNIAGRWAIMTNKEFLFKNPMAPLSLYTVMK